MTLDEKLLLNNLLRKLLIKGIKLELTYKEVNAIHQEENSEVLIFHSNPPSQTVDISLKKLA